VGPTRKPTAAAGDPGRAPRAAPAAAPVTRTPPPPLVRRRRGPPVPASPAPPEADRTLGSYNPRSHTTAVSLCIRPLTQTTGGRWPSA